MEFKYKIIIYLYLSFVTTNAIKDYSISKVYILRFKNNKTNEKFPLTYLWNIVDHISLWKSFFESNIKNDTKEIIDRNFIVIKK